MADLVDSGFKSPRKAPILPEWKKALLHSHIPPLPPVAHKNVPRPPAPKILTLHTTGSSLPSPFYITLHLVPLHMLLYKLHHTCPHLASGGVKKITWGTHFFRHATQRMSHMLSCPGIEITVLNDHNCRHEFFYF